MFFNDLFSTQLPPSEGSLVLCFSSSTHPSLVKCNCMLFCYKVRPIFHPPPISYDDGVGRPAPSTFLIATSLDQRKEVADSKRSTRIDRMSCQVKLIVPAAQPSFLDGDQRKLPGSNSIMKPSIPCHSISVAGNRME